MLQGQFSNLESAHNFQWNRSVRWPAGGADLSARPADNSRARARACECNCDCDCASLSLCHSSQHAHKVSRARLPEGSTKPDADKHASDNVEKRCGTSLSSRCWVCRRINARVLRSYIPFEHRQNEPEACWRGNPVIAVDGQERCERNLATLFPSHSENSREANACTWLFSSSTDKRDFGKMKSPAFACRKNCSATFSVGEPYASAASSSSLKTLLVTCRYCHCPICGEFEDTSNDASPQPPSTSTTTCDLCERLHGRIDGCSDTVNAMRTEEHFGQRDRRRKCDESANLRAKITEKRDRTLRCDRLPLYESSSARCASSVVRWNYLAARFYDKSTKWRRLLWIIFLVLLALSPDLAAAQKHNTIAPHNKNTTIAPDNDGGEYIIFFAKKFTQKLRYYAG